MVLSQNHFNPKISWFIIIHPCPHLKYAFWDIPLYETLPQVEAQSCQLIDLREKTRLNLNARQVNKKNCEAMFGRRSVLWTFWEGTWFKHPINGLPLPVLNLVPATQLSESSARCQNRFCFYRQILKRRLPDKNFCQRSMCPSVCFHFPHAWAKNGGTCKPTADISSQRHVAHFRDVGFHSRIICDIL